MDDKLETKDDYIKSYSRIITWDAQDEIYVVRFAELPGCVTHGRTIQEAFKMGDEAAEAYLDILDDLKKPYPIPSAYVGKTKEFLLRLEMPLFQMYKLMSEVSGKSINEIMISRLGEAAAMSVEAKNTNAASRKLQARIESPHSPRKYAAKRHRPATKKRAGA